MCSNYYANREAIAREALSELDAESLSKIAIVQSSATDLIVPNSAQVLPVQSVIIDRAEDFDASLKLGSRENKSLVYRLPPDLTGRADGAKLLLPQAYRNHLFWSQEKMQSVVDFIRAIVRNAV
jgi:hypothetical protein